MYFVYDNVVLAQRKRKQGKTKKYIWNWQWKNKMLNEKQKHLELLSSTSNI